MKAPVPTKKDASTSYNVTCTLYPTQTSSARESGAQRSPIHPSPPVSPPSCWENSSDGGRVHCIRQFPARGSRSMLVIAMLVIAMPVVFVLSGLL